MLAGKVIVRSRYRNKQAKLIVKNTKGIEKYYQNKSRFNGIYSRNDLPKEIKMSPM